MILNSFSFLKRKMAFVAVPFAAQMAVQATSYFSIACGVASGASLAGTIIGLCIKFRKKFWEWAGYQFSWVTPASKIFDRYALAYYLANQIKSKGIFSNTQFIDLNLTGSNDSIQLPIREFSDRNKSFAVPVEEKGQPPYEDFTVYLLQGDNPKNFYFEIWSKNVSRVMGEVVRRYGNLFYVGENPLFPIFFYEKGWTLTPSRMNGNLDRPEINFERQKEVIQFVTENIQKVEKSQIRGLLLSGPSGTGKTCLTYLLGAVLQRQIFVLTKEMNRQDFIESIKSIDNRSILSICDLDRTFLKGNPEGIQPDMLLTLFDKLPANVLVLISTNSPQLLTQIYGLTENENRIARHFEF